MKIMWLVIVPLTLTILYFTSVANPKFADLIGGSSTFSTFITSLLTYYYVVLTGMIVRQMVQAQEEDRRPYVVVDIEFERFCVWFSLRNLGKRPANNITVDITPDLTNSSNKPVTQLFFKEPISFFPPGGYFRSVIDTALNFNSLQKPEKYLVKITYSWDNHKPVIEKHNINIGHFANWTTLGVKDIEDVAKSLEKIERHIEELVKTQTKI